MLIGRSFWAVASSSTDWRGGASNGWRDAIAQATQALAEAGRPLQVQVWLSGALCPALWLNPPNGLRDGAEWHAWLSATVVSRHPLQDECDPPLVWVESNAVKPTLAAAMPRSCLQLLEAQLQHCRLESIKPIWSHAFGRSEMDDKAARQHWAVFDGEALTSVDIGDDAVTAAMTLDGVEDLSQAQAIFQRRAATASVDRMMFFRLDEAPLALSSGVPQPMWTEVSA